MIEVKVDDTRAQAKLAALGNADLTIKKRITAYGALTLEEIRRGLRGRYLNVRTGALWRGVNMRVRQDGDLVRLALGTGPGVGTQDREVKYASIHEHGGTIKAKNVKYLTIPFPGVKGRARDFWNTRVVKRGGKLMIVQNKYRFGPTGKGKVTGFKALFLLKKEVQIPARGWLSLPIAAMSPQLEQALNPREIIRDTFRDVED